MRFLIFVILTMCLALSSLSAEQKIGQDKDGYILILSSYSYDNPLGTEISKAIRTVLEKKNSNLKINTTHAGIGDRKSFNGDRFGMQGGFSEGRVNKDIFLPSVLVLVGDEAWMLYRIMNLRGLWENIPVVLSNVRPFIMNDYNSYYKYRDFADSLMIPVESSTKELRVTGVTVDDNISQTLAVMSGLIPSVKEINFVSQNNYQHEYSLYNLRDELSRNYPNIRLNVYNRTQNNGDSLQTVLNSLPQGSVVLLRDNYSGLSSSVPIFALNGSYNDIYTVGGYTGSINALAIKTADYILQIHNGTEPSQLPFISVGDEAPRLNMAALKHFKLDDNTNKQGAIYVNIPPPFRVQHLRGILFTLLIAVVVGILAFYSYRFNQHDISIKRSLERLKKLYGEYDTIYMNLPAGLALYDKDGRLLNRNPQSDAFYKHISELGYNCDINFNKIKEIKTNYFEIINKEIQDEQSAEKNTLAVIIDRRGIEHEKEAKNRIFNQLVTAMKASDIGVAWVNLIDRRGFSTDEWKQHLGLDEQSADGDTTINLLPEDAAKIQTFRKMATEGTAQNFIDTLTVCDNGTKHWIRCASQVFRYAPADGEVILVDLIVNIDKQKEQEHQLADAVALAKESYRMKSAFIINIDEEIHTFLNNLNTYVEELIASNDPEEYAKLAANIEKQSDSLLLLVVKAIELSKNESPQQEDKV